MYRYERGQMMPGGEKLALLARALDCSIDWLLTGSGRAPRSLKVVATGTDG